jgi:hypothetical protein
MSGVARKPTEVSEHALDRLVERHGEVLPLVAFKIHPGTFRQWALGRLMTAMANATFVEFEAGNDQAIWTTNVKWTELYESAVLLVVGANGTVRTVLPRGARKPKERR